MLCIASFEDGMKETVPQNSQKEKSHPVVAVTLQQFQQAQLHRTCHNTLGTGSHHCNQKLNQWDVKRIKNALEEWHYWEECRVRMGLKHLEMSKAQIAKKYGLSLSTFENFTLGKVQGYEHHSDGARQPQVLSAGKQLICFSTDTLFGVHVGKLI